MHIKSRAPESVLLGSLKPGDVFALNGSYFIRGSHTDVRRINITALHNGSRSTLGEDAQVMAFPDAVLNLEGK